MFKLAVEVMEILPESPLRSWKLPAKNDELDGAYLFPKEDALVLACKEVPLVRRLFFGLAAREGIRRGRIVTLRWDRLRLSEHGHKGVARVPGKPNKPPVVWVLTDGTAEALRRWRRICPSEEWVFPAEAVPRYARRRAGHPMYVQHFAEDLRTALRTAGVDRPELFEPDEGFRRLVGHDLRATHVTLARANGVSDEVIRRRTRHTTTKMIDRYDHAVGLYEELDCGMLTALHEAIPELAEMEPSEEWVRAGLGEPSDASIVGESSEHEAYGKTNR
ncbi:MAG: site-specific integrase [Myxococcales bacterium]|nr:site-specific integrase [Myxococcales bacterium]